MFYRRPSTTLACVALCSSGCQPDDARQDPGNAGPHDIAPVSESASNESASQSDDDDDDDDDDGPAVDPDEEGSDCGEVDFEPEVIPPNVLLVLDKSGSMTMETWLDGGVQKRRWESLYGVVEFLVENYDNALNLGAKLFPAPDAIESPDKLLACKVDPGVEVEPAPANGQNLLDTIPGPMVEVWGDTPTNTGLTEALTYLLALDDEAEGAIVLIIDGRTNCEQTDAELQATAANALAAGFPIYVVGIDVNAPTGDSLQGIAEAGGTGMFHNSSDAGALQIVLDDILGQITSCVIPLDPEPMFSQFVEVELPGGVQVPWLQTFNDCAAAAAAGTPDGWIYPDPDSPFDELELCGTYCSQFLQDLDVHIAYECPPPE